MSCFTLQDGTGTGNKARVSSEKRLLSESVTRDHNRQASLDGDAFNLSTGTINLTSDSESALFYFKNNGTRDVVFNNFIINYATSTGGALGDTFLEFVKNPTAGTIVSGASSATVINRNLGSSNILDADAFKGAEGNTFTDGETFFTGWLPQVQATIFLDSEETTLPRGASIGIKVTPASGNTSVNVIVAATCYLREAV